MRAAASRLRVRWGQRRDERGAFTLVELITVCGVGIIVLGIATGMLTSMMSLSFGETNKNDAQIKARQGMETGMRYLKNAVPLANCTQWKANTTVTNTMSDPEGVADACAKWSALNAGPIISYSPNQIMFYAMPPGASSGASPRKYSIRIDSGQLVVEEMAPNFTTPSMLKTACQDAAGAMVGSSCGAGTTGYWPATWVTTAVVPLNGGVGTITALDDSGTPLPTTATTNPTVLKTIRTVLLDVSVNYQDRNRSSQSMVFRADAAIRSTTYADRVANGDYKKS